MNSRVNEVYYFYKIFYPTNQLWPLCNYPEAILKEPIWNTILGGFFVFYIKSKENSYWTDVSKDCEKSCNTLQKPSCTIISVNVKKKIKIKILSNKGKTNCIPDQSFFATQFYSVYEQGHIFRFYICYIHPCYEVLKMLDRLPKFFLFYLDICIEVKIAGWTRHLFLVRK